MEWMTPVLWHGETHRQTCDLGFVAHLWQTPKTTHKQATRLKFPLCWVGVGEHHAVDCAHTGQWREWLPELMTKGGCMNASQLNRRALLALRTKSLGMAESGCCLLIWEMSMERAASKKWLDGSHSCTKRHMRCLFPTSPTQHPILRKTW